MMMLSSGVICGLTLSDRVAFLKDTLVAPLDVACWYGISVPCSIVASTWSAVITRGLEMILPLPSACNADTSRLRKRDNASLNKITENTPGTLPARQPAGRLTPGVWLKVGIGVAICPVKNPVA